MILPSNTQCEQQPATCPNSSTTDGEMKHVIEERKGRVKKLNFLHEAATKQKYLIQVFLASH